MDNSNFICNFCSHSFKSISSLVLHQRTANYCIKIQNNKNNITNNYEITKLEEINSNSQLNSEFKNQLNNENIILQM